MVIGALSGFIMASLSSLTVEGLWKFLGSYFLGGVSVTGLSNKADIFPVILFVLVWDSTFKLKGLYMVVYSIIKSLVFWS